MITEGEKAPAFSGKDQAGQVRKLSDYRNKKLVIYFYPQDDTPTCTIQACNVRDNYTLLKEKGIEIIGISPDDVGSHRKFTDKFHLPFPIIADPNRKIIEKFGVWGEKTMFGNKYMGVLRTTFLVNEKGIVHKVIRRPKNKDHVNEILSFWK